MQRNKKHIMEKKFTDAYIYANRTHGIVVRWFALCLADVLYDDIIYC